MKESNTHTRRKISSSVYEYNLIRQLRKKLDLTDNLETASDKEIDELLRSDYHCLSCEYVQRQGFLFTCPLLGEFGEYVLYWRQGHRPKWHEEAKDCDLYQEISSPIDLETLVTRQEDKDHR